jgi:hypothetical protein
MLETLSPRQLNTLLARTGGRVLSRLPSRRLFGIPHPDDPQKEAEHEAAMALVTQESASFYAPAGAITELASSVQDGVRADGTLLIRRGTTVRWVTAIGSNTSTLQIGTPEEPVTWETRVNVWFRDVGPIDPVKDPFALGHGLVWHGTHKFYAEPVQPFAFLAIAPKVGDRTITLFAPATNWAVGQRIVIVDTRREFDPENHQNEERVIASISGTVVSFDVPLAYDHPAVVSKKPMSFTGSNVIAFPAAGNLCQPITFQSENKDDLARRGHIMFMHNKTGDAKGVASHHNGRTDKRIQVTDPTPGDPASYGNVRGRYGWHYHRNGGALSEPRPTLDGFVIWDSPGWGLVNHDSHVEARNGFTYKVLGCHLVGEAGSEIGLFSNILCAYAKGSGRPALGEGVTGRDGSGFADRENFADGGHGTWTESGGIKLDRIYVYGTAAANFALFSNMTNLGIVFQPFKISNLDPELRAYFPRDEDPSNGNSPYISPSFVPYRMTECVGVGGIESLNTWFVANPASLFPQDRVWDSTITRCRFAGYIMHGYSGHFFRDECFYKDAVHSLIHYALRERNCHQESHDSMGLHMPMEDLNSWVETDFGGGSPSVIEGGYYDAPEAMHKGVTQGRKRTIHLDGNQDFADSAVGLNATLDYFAKPIQYIYGRANPGYWKYWIKDDPPYVYPHDVTTFGGKYVSAREQDPRFSLAGMVNIPAYFLYKPDGTARTVGELRDEFGLYFGGQILPPDDQLSYHPKVAGVLHDEPAKTLPKLTVLTPDVTDAETYVLRALDSTGAEITSPPTTLRIGWNCVIITADGIRRGVPIERLESLPMDWPDNYGSEGYAVAGGGADLKGRTLTPNGAGLFTWDGSPTDPRAPFKSPDQSGRVAACWYSSNPFTLDFDPQDSKRVTVYCVDWDRQGRSQKVELLDSAGSPVGDAKTLDDFGDGSYVTFDVTGPGSVRVSTLAGINAVASAIFFDGPTAPPPPKPAGATVTAGSLHIRLADGSEMDVTIGPV